MKEDSDDIKEKIKMLGDDQAWNHNFVLPNGLETRPGNFSSPAKNVNKLARIQPLLDSIGLQGKSVIDMGCNEGFFSVELAKRGAHVRGYDADYNRIEKAKFIQGIIADDLDISYECLDILQEGSSIPEADIALCLGFLHRIPDPISVVKTMCDLADCVVFEWKAQYAAGPNLPSAMFSTQSVNEKDQFGTEYWLLSVDVLKKILKRYGFDHTYLMHKTNGKRELMVASRFPISNLKTQNEFSRRVSSLGRLFKETIKLAINLHK